MNFFFTLLYKLKIIEIWIIKKKKSFISSSFFNSRPIWFDFFFGPSKNVPQENLVDNQNPVEGETPSFRTSPDGDEAPSIKSSPSLLKNQNINYKEKRLTFKSERIEGSVNLYGATLDEIILRDYFETIKKKKIK